MRLVISATRLVSLGWVLRKSLLLLLPDDILVQKSTALFESYPAISMNTSPI